VADDCFRTGVAHAESCCSRTRDVRYDRPEGRTTKPARIQTVPCGPHQEPRGDPVLHDIRGATNRMLGAQLPPWCCTDPAVTPEACWPCLARSLSAALRDPTTEPAVRKPVDNVTSDGSRRIRIRRVDSWDVAARSVLR